MKIILILLLWIVIYRFLMGKLKNLFKNILVMMLPLKLKNMLKLMIIAML